MTIIDRTSPNCPGWKSYPDGTEDDKIHYKENLDDYDPNEDHNCVWCGKPLPGRFLHCNAECLAALDKHMEEM
jgi:hypothetical protein